MNERVPYTRLGMVIVAGLVLFAVGIFLVGSRQRLFADTFRLYAVFNDVAGLEEGAAVRVAGLETGIVEEIYLPQEPGGQVKVEMKIETRAQPLIRTDSRAKIQSVGLLGEKYISISIGSPEFPVVEEGMAIAGERPMDFEKVAEEARKAVANIGEVSRDLKLITERVLSGRGTVGRLLMDDKIYRELRLTLASARRSTAALERTVNKIAESRGTLGRLIEDDSLYREIKAAVAGLKGGADSVEQLVERINRGEGTVGKLVQSDELYREVRRAVADLRRAIGSVERAVSGIDQNGEPGALGLLRDASIRLNEVLEALKRNIFLRGFFKDRGYWSSADFQRHKLTTPVTETPVREYRFAAEQLFDAEKYDAVLKKPAKLDPIGLYLMNNPHELVVIESYVGPTGQMQNNMELSLARALAVRNYLAENFPLEDDKLKIEGFGEEHGLSLGTKRGAGLIAIKVYPPK